MDDFEFGWVCGIIEGEASFTAVTYKRVRRRGDTTYTYSDKAALLRVAQVDRSILDRLQALTGVGQVRPKKTYSPLSKQRQFEWKVLRRPELREFLPLILPYLSQRRQGQAQKIIDLLA